MVDWPWLIVAFVGGVGIGIVLMSCLYISAYWDDVEGTR